jgi:hypothetical protein
MAPRLVFALGSIAGKAGGFGSRYPRVRLIVERAEERDEREQGDD